MSTCGVSICFLMSSLLFIQKIHRSTFLKKHPITSAYHPYRHAFAPHHCCPHVGLIFPLLRWRWCRESWPKLLTSYMENLNGDPGQVIHGSAWTPDLHLSLSQDLVVRGEHGAGRVPAPCLCPGIPGSPEGLSMLCILKGPCQCCGHCFNMAKADGNRRGVCLYWTVSLSFSHLTTLGSTHPGDLASKSSQFTLILSLVCGTIVQTRCPSG